MLNATIANLLPSWVDVVWTAAILSGLGYFFRDRLAKLIDARLQHGYNAELEKLKDELSRSSKEIETLRSSVLSLRAQRQAGVEKRKLEAIDQLWAAVKALQPRKAQSSIMAVIKFESAVKRAKDDPKVREYFELIGGGKVADDKHPSHQAHDAQPYVSPLAWALFDAYQAAVSYLFLQLTILKTGMDAEMIKDPKEMIGLLSEALPDWKAALETQGTRTFPEAIDEIEKRLLAELQNMILGDEDDEQQIARASRIAAKISEANRNELQAKAAAVPLPGGNGDGIRA